MPCRPTDEIIALWTAVYGEPPTIRTDICAMIQVLVSHLPEAPAYDADVFDRATSSLAVFLTGPLARLEDP